MDIKNTSYSDKNIYYHVVFVSILSILATIFSIWALCVTWPRVIEVDKSIKLGFDYIGVIVGALSILVALLLGWQIFYSIDTRNKITKLESLQESLNEQLKLAKERNIRAETKTKYHISRMQGLSLVDRQPYTAYRAFFDALTTSLSINGEYVDISLKDLSGVIDTLKSNPQSKVNTFGIDKIKDISPECLKEYKPYNYIYENYLDIYHDIMDYINNSQKSNKTG